MSIETEGFVNERMPYIDDDLVTALERWQQRGFVWCPLAAAGPSATFVVNGETLNFAPEVSYKTRLARLTFAIAHHYGQDALTETGPQLWPHAGDPVGCVGTTGPQGVTKKWPQGVTKKWPPPDPYTRKKWSA